MKREQKDLLKSSTGAGKKPPSKGVYSINGADDEPKDEQGELMERDVIGGTPFWIIGNKWDGYFLAFGKYRLGDVKETKEQVMDYLNTDMWTIIGYYVGILCELVLADSKKNVESVADLEKNG